MIKNCQSFLIEDRLNRNIHTPRIIKTRWLNFNAFPQLKTDKDHRQELNRGPLLDYQTEMTSDSDLKLQPIYLEQPPAMVFSFVRGDGNKKELINFSN